MCCMSPIRMWIYSVFEGIRWNFVKENCYAGICIHTLVITADVYTDERLMSTAVSPVDVVTGSAWARHIR